MPCSFMAGVRNLLGPWPSQQNARLPERCGREQGPQVLKLHGTAEDGRALEDAEPGELLSFLHSTASVWATTRKVWRGTGWE